MNEAKRDGNYIPALLGVSNVDGESPVVIWADPVTHRLLVDTTGGGASGGTSAVDDSAFVAGTGEGTPMMGFVTADSVDSGDVGVVGMDTSRNLKVSIEVDNAGIGGGVQYTEDDPAAANPIGNAQIVVRADTLAGITTTDGDNVALRGTNNGELYVKHVDDIGATQSGTWNITNITGTVSLPTGASTAARQDTGNTSLATIAGAVTGSKMQVDVITLPGVAGDVANDAVDSGNPLKIGAHATNSVEAETQVANNDRVDIKADLNGVLITRPHTTLEEIITERVTNTNGTSTAFANFGAGGAGVHNYITTITVYNNSATDGYVDFRDGTGGAIIFTIPLPTLGGAVIPFIVPLKGAANTALAFDVSAALTTVFISVVGFQAQG